MIRFWKRPPNVPAEVGSMLRLTNASNHPNINDLWRVAKDLEAMKLSVKFFGYELAKALLASLPPLPAGGPFQGPQASKPATQADLEASWTRYWSAQLKENHRIHRRVWEHAYVLQTIMQAGKLKPGMTGLGLGATDGPVPAYLTGVGCRITALKATEAGAFPADLRDFDFCWSVSHLQHAGSLARGIELAEKSADTLKPGGVLVHTTEFNFTTDDQTIDNWSTVLYQRRHFEEMAKRLQARGCRVLPLDFSVGTGPLDRFIDMPPMELAGSSVKEWSHDTTHIKISIDGFPCTAFGLGAVKIS